MLVCVPLQPLPRALDGIGGSRWRSSTPTIGADLAVVGGRGRAFYVPPLFPRAPAIAALAAMPSLRVVQTLTAGIDLLRPHLPPGAVLCNAHGLHDTSTAEWVVTAMLATCPQDSVF